MKKKYVLFSLIIFFFCLGLLSSYFVSKNQNKKIFQHSYLNPTHANFTIHIASSVVDASDILFEYFLSVEDLSGVDNDFDSISDFRIKSQFRNSILKAILERKILFEYIKKRELLGVPYEEISDFCKTNAVKSDQVPKSLHTELEKYKFVSRECELSVLKVFFKGVAEKIDDITEDDIMNYYLKQKKQFYKSKELVIRHILLASESDAKKVRFLINRKNFVYMAKKYSIAPEANLGGKLGPYEKNEYPHVFNQPLKMKKGEISPVIKSAHGFHIFKLEEISPARYQTIDRVRNEIKQNLIEKKQERYFAALFKDAVSAVSIIIK